MARGGKREGAGRPAGTGKYGEVTTTMRVPVGLVEEVELFLKHKSYSLPLYTCSVSAGFPTAADDHMEEKIDLNHHLIQHPDATFFVRASGDSMLGAGIHDGDIMVVDRSLAAKSGKVVIAAVDGHLTVKRLLNQQGKSWLMPENDNYQPIELLEGNYVTIWGVVTTVLHQV